VSRRLDLELTEPERRHAAALRGRWNDLLYVPGPGFASALEPGLYASSFVILLEGGPALRVSSLTVPAFGGDLCRIRLEALVSFRWENLGSFFEPGRRGRIFAMSTDRRAGATRPPDQPGWSYEGPPLGEPFAAVTAVRIVRERVSGGAGDGAFAWSADRALALTRADGAHSLLLARPTDSDDAVLVARAGLYRGLLDPAAPRVPGAGPAELLGYGDWAPPLEISVELEVLAPPGTAA
jgi:hypothetical protein